MPSARPLTTVMPACASARANTLCVFAALAGRVAAADNRQRRPIQQLDPPDRKQVPAAGRRSQQGLRIVGVGQRNECVVRGSRQPLFGRLDGRSHLCARRLRQQARERLRHRSQKRRRARRRRSRRAGRMWKEAGARLRGPTPGVRIRRSQAARSAACICVRLVSDATRLFRAGAPDLFGAFLRRSAGLIAGDAHALFFARKVHVVARIRCAVADFDRLCSARESARRKSRETLRNTKASPICSSGSLMNSRLSAVRSSTVSPVRIQLQHVADGQLPRCCRGSNVMMLPPPAYRTPSYIEMTRASIGASGRLGM